MGLIKNDRQLAITRDRLGATLRLLTQLKRKYGSGSKWRVVSAGPLGFRAQLESEVREYLWLKRATPEQVMRRYPAVTMSEIGPFLARLRIASRKTQADLARMVGCSQPDIARIEDADYEGHTATTLRTVAEALGVELMLGARRSRTPKRVG
jgi:DNA-binding XRE family transcriptional regulator